MRLAAHGIASNLPPGWEGTIHGERQDLPEEAADRAIAGAAQRPSVLPVAHFATFPLGTQSNDFGADVVEVMHDSDIFVSLVEYDPAEAGSALFAHEGLPRRLDPRAFSSRQLQRTLPGQTGLQLFFHERGRAFCLYIVLGDAGDVHRLVRRTERVLATLEIEDYL